MKNKLLRIILVVIIALCVVCGIVIGLQGLHNNMAGELGSTANQDLPIYYMNAFYAHSFATPEDAIGTVDYAFVAKINGIKRTEYRNPVTMETVANGSMTKTIYDPYTIYDVTVIENIKGELTKKDNIEVQQKGGLDKDGKSYTFLENMGILNVGEYYILLVNASASEGFLRISHPKMVVSLGNINNDQEISKIKEISTLNNMENINNKKTENINLEYNSLEKVLEYKAAYLNQKVPSDKEEIVKSIKYDILYEAQ